MVTQIETITNGYVGLEKFKKDNDLTNGPCAVNGYGGWLLFKCGETLIDDFFDKKSNIKKYYLINFYYIIPTDYGFYIFLVSKRKIKKKDGIGYYVNMFKKKFCINDFFC